MKIAAEIQMDENLFLRERTRRVTLSRRKVVVGDSRLIVAAH